MEVMAFTVKNFNKGTTKNGWGGGYFLIPRTSEFNGLSLQELNKKFKSIRASITALPEFTIADYASAQTRLVGSGKFVLGSKEKALENITSYRIVGFNATCHSLDADKVKHLAHSVGTLINNYLNK